MKKFTTAAAMTAVTSLALAACSGSAGMIPQGASSSSPSGITSPGPGCQHARTRGAFTRLNDDGSMVPYMPRTDDPALVRTLQSSAKGSKQLAYFCGSIQPAQKLYVVFWGSTWSSDGDPDKIAPRLTSFLRGLKGSQWESAMTQYYGPVGTHITDDATLVDTYVDSAHQPPEHPTDSQVAVEARVAAAHFNDYSIDASYFIAMPHDHNPTGFDNGQYCAYHNSLTAPGGTIQFTNFPYIPDAGRGCGAGSVTSPGTDDGVSIVAGHEAAETNTDPIVNPNPTGWYNTTNGEIGDECAWTNLKNTEFSTGTFPTQPLWSNKANACVQ